jgi:two-component system phosphate regulon sensor histidine kinase PhoR
LALCSAALFCVLASRMRGPQSTRNRYDPAPPAGWPTWLTRLWNRGLERLRPGAHAGRFLESGSAAYGVCVLDRQYHVLWCNATSAAHFRIRAESAAGSPFEHAAELAAYVAAGDFSKPLQIGTAFDEEAVLSVSLVPYLKSQWLLLSRDVTLDARSESARRNGVADALHELCTPVTVLAGYLDTISRVKLDPWRSKEYLRGMEEQCRRMQRTIEDLLDLWTLQSAPLPPRHDRVAVGQMLAGVRRDMEALSGGRHRILVDAQPGVELLGAEGEIASAFRNLAVNAIRYTPPGGQVRLLWHATPEGAEFVAADTGIGIAREHISRLTERFYRVDREFSRKSGGTGLGLAIVKDVLTRHQAALLIESTPGTGSRFCARFPAHRVVETAGAVTPAARAEGAADAVTGSAASGPGAVIPI